MSLAIRPTGAYMNEGFETEFIKRNEAAFLNAEVSLPLSASHPLFPKIPIHKAPQFLASHASQRAD
jgi:hypothetical protein